MYLSLNWLREFVDLPDSLDPKDLAKELTLRCCEVEKIIDQKTAFENMVVARILGLKKHPAADSLQLVDTDLGQKNVQIVCGGSNLRVGMRVAVGLPGAKVVWHGTEEMTLKETKIRGESSYGMICAGEEIGLEAGGEKEILDLSTLDESVSAGTPLAKALGLDDTIYEIDNKTLTHRPDLWGHRGMAREIAAITGYPLKEPEANLKLPQGEGPAIQVNSSELCPRYTGLVIRNVKVSASPEWMQQKLRATDHSIISNLVDVTNLVMEEVGQPLHVFDLAKISGEIVVRTAKKGEVLKTLDGVDRSLDESMLVIADQEKALAIAGVMGGQDSGVFEETTDILIEAANFDPISVRQTSVKLGLRTDAVQRFEKSLDPLQCELAMRRAAELILELCPGAYLEGGLTDVANFTEKSIKLELYTDRVNSKIGVTLRSEEMASYLERLGFEILTPMEDRTESFWVKVPSWRATKDVDIEEDLVEEIARLYGYDRIPARIPLLPAKAPSFNLRRKKKHQVRKIFALGLGYDEVYNYSFYDVQRIAEFGLDEKLHLKLKNVLSAEQSHLRTRLIPNLTYSLKEAAKDAPRPALFELGRTYIEEGHFMPVEKRYLAAMRVFDEGHDAFLSMKGDLEYLLEALGVREAQFKAPALAPKFQHPFQSAEIWIKNECLGYLFALHPATAEELGFLSPVCGFELDFEALDAMSSEQKKYLDESKFPAISFDVSILASEKISYEELAQCIEKAIPELLKSYELFDIYAGKELGEGKRSLAFRLTLQAKDRTLGGSDLESSQKQVWSALEQLGAEIRGK